MTATQTLDIASWVLCILAIMSSGYCLHVMCILGRLRRDRRPACFSVFVLLAIGLMEGFVAHSRSGHAEYAVGWLVVHFAAIILIWWMVSKGGQLVSKRKRPYVGR